MASGLKVLAVPFDRLELGLRGPSGPELARHPADREARPDRELHPPVEDGFLGLACPRRCAARRSTGRGRRPPRPATRPARRTASSSRPPWPGDARQSAGSSSCRSVSSSRSGWSRGRSAAAPSWPGSAGLLELLLAGISIRDDRRRVDQRGGDPDRARPSRRQRLLRGRRRRQQRPRRARDDAGLHDALRDHQHRGPR